MQKLLVNKWLHSLILTALLIGATLSSDSKARWRQQLRNYNFDYYNILKPYKTADHVIIVDIDEKSLAHPSLGQWPWSRTKLAALVTELKKKGAAVIAFDMVFPEEDRASPRHLLNLLDDNEMSLQEIRDKLALLPDNDQIFADAIKDAGNVVTGFSFAEKDTRKSPFSKSIVKGKNVGNYVLELKGVTTNLKKISDEAAGNGSFFTSADTDGIIRRVPMLVTYSRHGGKIKAVFPSLSLESFRVLKNSREYFVDTVDAQYSKLNPGKGGIEGIKISKNAKRIPTTPDGNFLVYFAEPEPQKWYVSALDVLSGEVDPERIKGKIAIVGTSAVGLKDIRSTPLSPFRPGAEIHLNIIDQILEQKFLYRSIEAEGLEALAIFVLGGIIIVASPFVGAGYLLLLVLATMGAALFGGWYGFSEHGYLIDVLYPSVSILVLFMASALFAYMRTEAERKQISGAFGMYVSHEFMEELTRDPDKLKLGGETRDLSVMFTDIRSFTTISESLSPEELIQLMNDFLTPMSDLVMSNRGTIDKYMGDAMMAFWNAPLDDPEHARNACLTALKMNEALVPINEGLAAKTAAEGKPPLVLRAGIGVNTGPASVGNMGSKQRFAYSALGDTVNLASRLEGQTKTYGVTNLIGETTHRHVQDLATLELDLIRVKGKLAPVRIFTLLGQESLAQDSAFKAWLEVHNEMLAQYRKARFDEAERLIAECLKSGEGQLREFYALYRERIAKYRSDPPPADWDGVYVATSK